MASREVLVAVVGQPSPLALRLGRLTEVSAETVWQVEAEVEPTTQTLPILATQTAETVVTVLGLVAELLPHLRLLLD